MGDGCEGDVGGVIEVGVMKVGVMKVGLMEVW